jgi:hypothetical protein
MKFRIKNTSTTIKILAIYQIICGLIGLGIWSRLLLQTETINGVLLLIFTLAFGLYYFSIKSGGLLLQKNQINKGLIYSLISNLLQSVAISACGYKYEIYSGIKGIVGINFTHGFDFKMAIGFPEFNFAYNSSKLDVFLYINVFAIIVIILLYDIHKELNIKTQR